MMAVSCGLKLQSEKGYSSKFQNIHRHFCFLTISLHLDVGCHSFPEDRQHAVISQSSVLAKVKDAQNFCKDQEMLINGNACKVLWE